MARFGLEWYRTRMMKAPDDAGGGGAAPSGGGSAPAPASGSSPGGSSSAPSGATPSPSPSPGPTATPSPSPSPGPGGASPVGTQPSPAAVPGEDSFDGMFEPDDDDFDWNGMGAQPQQPQQPPTPQPAPPQPQTAPPTQQQPPATQSVTPGQQPSAAQPSGAAPQEPGQQAPTFSPAEPGRLAEAMQRDYDQIVPEVARRDFALSQEDVQALETDAAAFIPTLLARLYVRSQVNLFRQMQSTVPAMLQQLTARQAAYSENEGKFYARWPGIDKTKHGAVVAKLGRLYRQNNPDATLDQMIEDLGPAVAMAAKIDPATMATAVAPQPAAAQPSAFQPTGMTRVQPSPFRPAGGGGASPQPSPQAPQMGPWDGLAGDLTEDDE